MEKQSKNTEVEKFLSKYGNVTEEYKFYGGKYTLRYDIKKHVYYRVTEDSLIKLDGVTTICKILDKSNVLIPWACKMMELKLLKSVESHLVTNPEGAGLLALPKNEFDKLLKEAKSAHKDKLEEAGAIGHKTHAWIEDFIHATIHATMSGDISKVNETLLSLPEDEKARSAATAALDWITRHKVRFISTERKIFSAIFDYAGTMDGLCLADSCGDPKCCPEEFKDRKTLIDWKTSNYLYIGYILQTGAYKQAYQEETGEVVEDIWVIRLGKDDSKFEAWHVPPELQEAGWVAFYNALMLSRSMKMVEEGVQVIKDRKKKPKKTS